MTTMNRRELFGGAAAAAAATGLGVMPVSAQAPAAAMSGVFRHALGDVEVIQVLEGIRAIKMPDGFITNLSNE